MDSTDTRPRMPHNNSPCILFVPASGPAGSGEYMRCLMLAHAVARRWPDARIQFVVNGRASYARDVPYPAVLLDSSPAHATAAVRKCIDATRPDIVVFDNTGRAAQLAAAKTAGAACVFISSRPNARRKGLRWSRLRWLDQHWIAQPQWATPPATLWELFKKWLRPVIETLYLDAVFEESEPTRRQLQRAQLGIEARPYLAFCAGGGGQFAQGPRAPDVMLDAATAIAGRTGLACVVVLGPNYAGPAAAPPAGVVTVSQLNNANLMDLLHDAELVVTSGGDVLMQALVQQKLCVAVPVAGDQPARIRRCAERGLIEPAALTAEDVTRAVTTLLTDEPRRSARLRQLREAGMRNGLLTAIAALERLLERRDRGESD